MLLEVLEKRGQIKSKNVDIFIQTGFWNIAFIDEVLEERNRNKD